MTNVIVWQAQVTEGNWLSSANRTMRRDRFLHSDGRSKLSATIAGLAELDGAMLKAQWRTLYDSTRQRRINREWQLRRLA